MRWSRVLAPLALLFAAIALTGCRTAVEPVTGRGQFILTSRGEETRMGLQSWRKTLDEERPCRNRKQVAAVARVGRAISEAVDEEDFEWEFRAFESSQANAFCLPGGKVAVYSGLFRYVANDAELAAVVGHEIGHALARHGGERMTQGMLQNLGELGLSVVLRSKPPSHRARWMAAYTGLTTLGVVLPYSRTHEYSADQIGLILMARAGYLPEASISFWSKFGASGTSSTIEEFLSTHPMGAKRRERLRSLLHRAQLEYDMAPIKLGLGTVY